MRRPCQRIEDEILDGLVELREERIARLTRRMKKGKSFVARYVKF